jgi:PIN domain
VAQISLTPAWTGFLNAILKRFRHHSIAALSIDARAVFDRYFASRPPFDDRGSKEFPDAFVVEGLARYCKSSEISMYIVSGDAALRRAAEDYDTLIPLQTIEEVLAAATAASSADLEAIVDDVFNAPDFDQQFTEAVETDLGLVDFIYYGPLSDGAVSGAQLEEILDIHDYDVAAFDETKIGLIVQADVIRTCATSMRNSCATRTRTRIPHRWKPGCVLEPV